MNTTITTSLPLSPATLSEFFKNRKDVVFAIDYAASLHELKTHQAVLNYIANMKLHVIEVKNCIIDPELIHTFALMRDECNVELFYKVLGNVLYFCKYSEILYEDCFDAFNFDRIVAYVQQYSDSIILQSAFLNSIPLYTITCALSPEESGSKRSMTSTISDAVHVDISRNLLGLFALDNFLLRYLERTVALDEQIYFRPHFDRNMYQGQTMFKWFAVPENSYFLLVQHIVSSLEQATTRLDLVDLYAQLAAGLNDTDKIDALNQAIVAGGGMMKFIRASRKDIAVMNRKARKSKKRAKAAR